MTKPLWLEMIFSPAILWLILSPLAGSIIAWRFIISNSSEAIDKKLRRSLTVHTWLTIFFCNFGSSFVLLIIEILMYIDKSNIYRFSAIKIWDNPLTVIVYMIPIIISFFIIFAQIRRQSMRFMFDRTPIKVASWFMAALYSPWYIIIPITIFKNLTDVVD